MASRRLASKTSRRGMSKVSRRGTYKTSRRDITEQMSEAMRKLWETREGMRIREKLSSRSKNYGKCLERVMETGGGAKAFRDCARKSNIGQSFERIWRMR